MAKNDQPRVVAELGRPETPDETAARKAEQSRLYRDRKTLRNLIYALLVSVGLVAVIVFLVPRTDTSLLPDVDFTQVAAGAQSSMPIPLAVPELPEGWTSNAAEIRTATRDEVVSWYIGLITPGNQFLGLTQAVDANPSWLADQVAQGYASGVVTIDGVEWTIYDNRSSTADVGNAKYAMSTESAHTTYVLAGGADPADFETVARAISANVLAQQSTVIDDSTTDTTSGGNG
ncbi:MAG: DUF4245 domain-containing protein [Herbiconiux sp.]|uniref:DUF4245 domain-containing protein n=1 Tax=Herbiconiux sp. TaxID=1871186 RepID=UPI0011FBAC90|nr:DUF4245 domain-containing protein [Herbiconiux sp.]TAJ49921.1 MAG: DUF4245 domain-containing protein [Herbiconiux sp.]